MSIALEARVAELEKQVADLSTALLENALALEAAVDKIAELTASRKPGPKPKDSNG